MALGHNISINSIGIVKSCTIVLTKVFPSSLTVRNIQDGTVDVAIFVAHHLILTLFVEY